MCEQINQLCEGQSVERPVYSFVNHNRIPETVTIEPPCVLIIDGILIFENEELRDLMDVKIYVQTDDDVRLARRIPVSYTHLGDEVLCQSALDDRRFGSCLWPATRLRMALSQCCDLPFLHTDTDQS